MKFIFDFDDVLFNNTTQFKKQIFNVLVKNGVPEPVAMEYYAEVREKEFSLKKFIVFLFAKLNIKNEVDQIYKSILMGCSKFLNTELIEEVKKMGKENCYLLTNGEFEFQQDKIKYAGILNLFDTIYIVPGTKKEIIHDICDNNSKEKIVFVEDRVKFIKDLDFVKYPNLKAILYDEQGLEKLKAEIK
jgi:FMN phosphatase YigB (HAD superfamily)